MKYRVGQQVLAFFGGPGEGTVSPGIILEELPGDEFRYDKYMIGCPHRGTNEDWSRLQEFVMFEEELTTIEEVFGVQVQAR